MLRESRRISRWGERVRHLAAALLVLAALQARPVAQDDPARPPEERALRELQRRNQDLEERVRRLEQALEDRARGEAVAAAEGLEHEEGYGFVFHYGEVVASFEVFGDVGFVYSAPEPPGRGNSWFGLGAVDFFVNAQVGDHFRMLSETVLTGNTDDTFDVRQMRLLGMWEFSDQLYAKLGTEHSRMSRWDQLYHHGLYLQTSVSRPFVAFFEPVQGILPIHHTGLELGGAVRPEVGAIEYWGAVSNGRGPVPSDTQRTTDRNDSKRLDAGVAYYPFFLPDLRVGASFTYDEIPSDPASMDPDRALSTRERIATAHAEYYWEGLHILGELAFIDHESRATSRNDDSNAGYLQVSYRHHDWTPYARFDYRNMSAGDPFYAPSMRDLDRWKQILGVRHELAQNVALKLEFGVGEVEEGVAGSTRDDTIFDFAVQLAWSL